MRKKYYEYEDEVKVKRGIFKGKKGRVSQIMPNGKIGVDLENGKHIYFEEKDLENLGEIY